jgi:broad specificity phosphatase PhoE
MLYLVRHGQPLSESASPDSALVSDAENVLTETGISQANRLASQFVALANAGKAGVFCSPLARALQTAEPIAAALGVSLEIDARLSERDYSRTSGLTIKAWRELQERGYASTSTSLAGEETLESQRKRVESWYADIESQLRVAPDQNIIVVCHGGTIEHLLGVVMDIPVANMSRYFFACECSSICKLKPFAFDDGGFAVRIDAINSFTM